MVDDGAMKKQVFFFWAQLLEVHEIGKKMRFFSVLLPCELDLLEVVLHFCCCVVTPLK